MTAEATPAPGEGLGRPAVPRLQRQNLKEDVAAHVRELIFSGQLRPGTRVDQDHIAETLGVSKLPVREALILLQSEGLIDSLPRRGAFVARLTPDDIRDHYRIFGLVVSLAVERAAERVSEEDLARLEWLLEQMERWDSWESAAGQEALNHEFHRIINRAGGSRRLNSVLGSLANVIPARLYHETRGWTEGAQREHREILEALRDRDGPRAAAAAVAHTESGAAHAVRMLRQSGFWDSSDGPAPSEKGTRSA